MTSLPRRAEDGKPGPRSEEVCRVSSDVEELRQYARDIVKQYPAIVCVLRAKDKRVIERIQNDGFARKVVLSFYSGIGLWLAAMITLGSGILYAIYALAALAGSNFRGHPPALSPMQWAALLLGGLAVGTLLIAGRFWLSARQRVKKSYAAIKDALTPEEMVRYKQADRLCVSSNPEERKRGRQLAKEYHYRLQEIMRSKRQGRSEPPND